jgi:hypothetical protein
MTPEPIIAQLTRANRCEAAGIIAVSDGLDPNHLKLLRCVDVSARGHKGDSR